MLRLASSLLFQVATLLLLGGPMLAMGVAALAAGALAGWFHNSRASRFPRLTPWEPPVRIDQGKPVFRGQVFVTVPVSIRADVLRRIDASAAYDYGPGVPVEMARRYWIADAINQRLLRELPRAG